MPESLDPQALRQALEDVLSGDVRFDRLSRGLYASDASVYQIVPLGVVLPKNEQDILDTIEVCTRFGVPITARGGGTSQAGQCIGPGVVLDFSRYFDRVIEINPAEKWARVEPGVVLDDLNRQAKEFGLQFAPDISTSNRATIGGMVANNSSGTHSVIHGKTIDHILGLRVVLADGSIISTGPMNDADLASRCGQANLEGACYRTVRRLAQTHAAEIERRFPKILRRVGGYNLDRFVPNPASGGRKPPGAAPDDHQGADAPRSPCNLPNPASGGRKPPGAAPDDNQGADAPRSPCNLPDPASGGRKPPGVAHDDHQGADAPRSPCNLPDAASGGRKPPGVAHDDNQGADAPRSPCNLPDAASGGRKPPGVAHDDNQGADAPRSPCNLPDPASGGRQPPGVAHGDRQGANAPRSPCNLPNPASGGHKPPGVAHDDNQGADAPRSPCNLPDPASGGRKPPGVAHDDHQGADAPRSPCNLPNPASGGRKPPGVAHGDRQGANAPRSPCNLPDPASGGHKPPGVAHDDNQGADAPRSPCNLPDPASGGRKPPGVAHGDRQGANAPRSPFNLSDIFVGSEGTLGITLEATVKLIDLPRSRCLMVVHFADLLDALEATPWILAHQPAAVEVMDRFILDSTKLNPEASRLRDFLVGEPGAVLLVEFYADRPEQLPARLEALEADLRGHHVNGPFVRALEPAQQERIWKLRKFALGLSMAEKGDAKAISFVEDTAVAPEHLRAYIAEFLEKIRAHQTTAGVYAHASVGCLHVRPVINLKTEEGVRHFESLAGEVAELVLKYGGALSGEHGDGLVRSPFMEKMFGPTLYQAFRELKRTFDPRNLFNPGKIVDAPPLANNLRYGPAYVTPEVPTTFDFSAEGGLTRAVELCAGVGECRKKRQGVMCPSYQATCEEQHSTRGRANVLRLALTGQLGLQGLTDGVVKEALDLCLECKACKSECPTNVDIARLKAEFLHQFHRKHGLPWRNWIFGHVDRWYRRGSAMPRLFNLLTRSGVGRWFNEMLFGIDRRRVPPALARETWSIAQSRGDRSITGPRTLDRLQIGPHGHVFLFPDTFLNYVEPDLGRHVQRLSTALGCGVENGLRQECGSGQLMCCGRPYISNGMLDQAVTAARHNVERLHPWAAEGKPIIACEPSCILTIKDDYPALLREEWRDKAKVVALACRTFEEFVLELWTDTGKVLVDPTRVPKKILVLAHCHQRSLVGVQPLLKLLRRLPGTEVIDLDVGCCGMAGSFGYEKEHYEISRLVGEQRLFPALRKMGPDTVVVAPGFSCRAQIAHFTGIRAVHPVELFV